jgi:hypothetical protein
MNDPGMITATYHMPALFIKKEWLDLILSGAKTWELRGKANHKSGVIALIESGTGKIMGTAGISTSFVLPRADLNRTWAHHRVSDSSIITYETIHVWPVANAHRLPEPLPFNRKVGPVIWITLDEDVSRQLYKHYYGSAYGG